MLPAVTEIEAGDRETDIGAGVSVSTWVKPTCPLLLNFHGPFELPLTDNAAPSATIGSLRATSSVSPGDAGDAGSPASTETSLRPGVTLNLSAPDAPTTFELKGVSNQTEPVESSVRI